MNRKRMVIILITFIIFTILIINNINVFFLSVNAVVGVDISHYQGNVDFEKMQKENIKFVFIKATEGAKYKDEMFDNNYKNAQNSGSLIGAYHFFSAKSSGDKQAINFIKNVGDLKGKLPPVVDVEVYGSDDGTYDIVTELKECLNVLEDYYGAKPIIYASIKNYKTYIESNFESYPLWIRSIYFPACFITKEWTFWQYSDSERKDFYDGEEECIDMNVFNGNIEELENMLLN